MSPPMQRPLFVTFEGGEGAGKSTIIKRLLRELKMLGLSVLSTREPGGAKLGEQIRAWLLHHQPEVSIGARAELLLFLAARAQHLEEVIEPALAEKRIVLCDRFNDSTIAYQGAARGLGVGLVEQLCEFTCKGTTPDITFFLDVDPQVGLARTRKTAKDSAAQGEVDRIESEKLTFHEMVRDALSVLAQNHPQRIKKIDAAQSLEAVYEQCRAILLKTLSE